MHAPGTTTAGGAVFRVVPRRHHFTISNVIAAKLNPTSTTANDSSGAPPIWASDSSGPSVWLKATAPQGNPPNGTVDLSHSTAAHNPVNHSGHPGSRRTTTANMPKTPGNRASIAERAIHGKAPTSPLIHGNSGR